MIYPFYSDFLSFYIKYIYINKLKIKKVILFFYKEISRNSFLISKSILYGLIKFQNFLNIDLST